LDVNKVWLCGVVGSDPTLTKLGSDTEFTSFIIHVNETFLDRLGNRKTKKNVIDIECLGRTAHVALKKIKKGKRVWLEGYLRQDPCRKGVNIRVRAYSIQEDISDQNESHVEGLKQALEIIKNCLTTHRAVDELEDLIFNSGVAHVSEPGGVLRKPQI
jgi:single stranded DNA-binding protein